MTTAVNEDQSLIEFLKNIDTPTVANAIELLDVCPRTEGFASLKLHCLFPEPGVMCGYATTAHVEGLRNTVGQILSAERRILDLAHRPGFAAATLRNKLLH